VLSKKKKKKEKKREIRGNKKGQVPGTSKEKKSETRGKNGQVSESRIRGTRYPPERKKENIEHLILLKKPQVQERYVSPQKSKSRIKLSPFFSPLSPFIRHTCIS